MEARGPRPTVQSLAFARARKPSRRVDSCMARARMSWSWRQRKGKTIRDKVAVAVEARQPWRGSGQAGPHADAAPFGASNPCSSK